MNEVEKIRKLIESLQVDEEVHTETVSIRDVDVVDLWNSIKPYKMWVLCYDPKAFDDDEVTKGDMWAQRIVPDGKGRYVADSNRDSQKAIRPERDYNKGHTVAYSPPRMDDADFQRFIDENC